MVFKYEKGSFWVEVIGLFLAIALAYVACQAGLDVAQRSGQFKKPQVEVSLGGGLPLEPSVDTKLLIGARKITGDKSVVIGEAPFIVSNKGDATLENTTVTFRFHKMFHRDVLEQLDFAPSGGFEASQIQHSFTTNGELQYSSYLIPALNPGQTLAGTEPLYLEKSSLEISAPVRTADNKSMTVGMRAQFSLSFMVTVAAKDVPTRDYPIEFETTECTSLDDLTQQAGVGQISRHLSKVRRDATFAQYLKALMFGVPDEHLYLVFEELDERPADDGTLYSARPDPRIRLVSYKPVAWKLLFQ